MSSNDATKKRKVDTNDNMNGGTGCDGAAAAGVEDIIAEMKVHMTRMQSEIDGMRGRLSRMDKLEASNKELKDKCDYLETKCEYLERSMDGMDSTMQNKIDSMKGRLSEMNELKIENEKLKTKCESLERSVKILVKEQKWEYSAPDIPISYWISRGFEEDYIEEMKASFLEKIKDATCELRDGKEVMDEWITVGNDDPNVENPPTLLHDDILLPHWKELANAMQLHRNSGFTYNFSIENVQLTSSVLEILDPALRRKCNIDKFYLQNNDFANIREGIEFAVKFINSNETLTNFGWIDNTINRMEDAQYLIDAIISHPTIDHVGIESCFGNDIHVYDIMLSLLTSNKSFLCINLTRNNIRTGGGTAISDYLATNPPLEELFLSGNNLNDEDVRLMSQALKQNTNLQNLHLYDNNITEIGRSALCKAVYDPTSLNSMSDCNHVCQIHCPDFSDDVVWNLPEYTSTSKQNKALKTYHLLSVRNRKGSNVSHLNVEFGDEDENTLAIVPNVLECVQHYSREFVHRRLRNQADFVQPLSIMYEILRSWKMPELYEP